MKVSLSSKVVALGFSLFVGACSAENDRGAELADAAAFEPAPSASEIESVKARLKRFEGQTSFLNPMDAYYGGAKRSLSGGVPEAASAEGGRRDVQESDIFKVGKEGSKLLYLLNNYRGLQVVSFAKGKDQPELLGRVPATGNYPDTMYYDAAGDRLIVVERVWQDDSGEARYQEQLSRILVYDVRDPNAPAISQTVEFKGDVSDSRLVGNVLYTAVSISSNSRWNNEESKPVGMVYSFRLGQEIKKIAEFKLSLPTYRENMNIVEVANSNGTYAYYLVATLSNSRWGWWSDRASAIEVVDVSNAKGKITSVMVAPVKGQVIERSATHIKNDTLVVVSNYRSEVGEELQRVAVETYNFPSATSTKLSESEAEFRKMHIARELRKLKERNATAEQLEEARLKLESDKELGINGAFVEKSGKLEKILADSVVTVGDTTGQHASLQDVRYHGNYLYAFWVPRNLIDPLDVFDLSAPEKGIQHIGHHEFEGWIEHAFPLSHNGREFIMGLGTIVPSVNNEEGRRHPQARLFEVKKRRNGSVRIDAVSEMTFKDSNVWAELNSGDKFVEMRMTDADKGQGVIMFRVSMMKDRKYVTGGKLVGFDLSLADEDDVFTEGGLLASKWGWLRRVFTNTEIDAVNTFSDQELRVFDAAEIGAESKVFDAIGYLELARDVQSYVTLNDKVGVQVVQKGSVPFYYWGSFAEEPDAYVELRLVSQQNADAEVKGILSSVSVKGDLQDVKTIGNAMYVMTRTLKAETQVEGEAFVQPKQQYNVHLVGLDAAGKLAVTASASWVNEPETEGGLELPIGGPSRGFRPWFRFEKGKLALLSSGDMLAVVGRSMRLLSTGAELTAEKLATESCTVEGALAVDVKLLDGAQALSYKFPLDEEGNRIALGGENPSDKQPVYAQHWLAPLTLNRSAKTLACGTAVNVPGEVKEWTASHLVMQDTRLLDRVKMVETGNRESTHVWYRNVTRTVLASLEFKDGKAILRDMYDPASDGEARSYYGANPLLKLADGRYLFVERRDWDSYETLATFGFLSFDSQYRFLRETRAVNMDLKGSLNVVAAVSTPSGLVTMVTSGRAVQAVAWDQDLTGSLVPLSKRLTNGEWSKAEFKVVIYDAYSFGSQYGDAERQVNFNSASGVFTLPQGLYGIEQVKLQQAQ